MKLIFYLPRTGRRGGIGRPLSLEKKRLHLISASLVILSLERAAPHKAQNFFCVNVRSAIFLFTKTTIETTIFEISNLVFKEANESSKIILLTTLLIRFSRN